MQVLIRMVDTVPDEGADPRVAVVYTAGPRERLRQLRDERYELIGLLAAWHYHPEGGHPNLADTVAWFSQDVAMSDPGLN